MLQPPDAPGPQKQSRRAYANRGTPDSQSDVLTRHRNAPSRERAVQRTVYVSPSVRGAAEVYCSLGRHRDGHVDPEGGGCRRTYYVMSKRHDITVTSAS